MLFAQPHAPLCGLGLVPPQPPVPLSGVVFALPLAGHLGLGLPPRVRRPVFVEDPEPFLDDFGEPVAIDGRDCGLAIFSVPHAIDQLASAGFQAAGPRVLMPSANVPERAADDDSDPILELVDRRGIFSALTGAPQPFRYLVREVRPDGTLMSTLLLSEHPDQTSQ